MRGARLSSPGARPSPCLRRRLQGREQRGGHAWCSRAEPARSEVVWGFRGTRNSATPLRPTSSAPILEHSGLGPHYLGRAADRTPKASHAPHEQKANTPPWRCPENAGWGARRKGSGCAPGAPRSRAREWSGYATHHPRVATLASAPGSCLDWTPWSGPGPAQAGRPDESRARSVRDSPVRAHGRRGSAPLSPSHPRAPAWRGHLTSHRAAAPTPETSIGRRNKEGRSPTGGTATRRSDWLRDPGPRGTPQGGEALPGPGV